MLASIISSSFVYAKAYVVLSESLSHLYPRYKSVTHFLTIISSLETPTTMCWWNMKHQKILIILVFFSEHFRTTDYSIKEMLLISLNSSWIFLKFWLRLYQPPKKDSDNGKISDKIQVIWNFRSHNFKKNTFW